MTPLEILDLLAERYAMREVKQMLAPLILAEEQPAMARLLKSEVHLEGSGSGTSDEYTAQLSRLTDPAFALHIVEDPHGFCCELVVIGDFQRARSFCGCEGAIRELHLGSLVHDAVSDTSLDDHDAHSAFG